MDKGKRKLPIPPKLAIRNRYQASRQPNATSDFGGFPILPPPEPFQWYDVTESFRGIVITPNSPELFENEGSPRPRQICEFYHDGNKICSSGFGCPDLHGIFGLQPSGQGAGVGPSVERAAPVVGTKRKAGLDGEDGHSEASGSKRQF